MIDWARVAELRAEIGSEDFDEVVTLFLEEADEVILHVSATAGARQLEADLHFLKGAALNLGFAQLAALCQDGERKAAAGDVGVDLAQVQSCYRESSQALALGLAKSMVA